MTTPLFPYPNPDPLQRLNVYDSLMINAERWLFAHNYHRRRQNIYYQALYQPGIVCGLGVKAIAPPREAPRQFQDGRWLEIQPGIAIDIEGNPIIVDADTDRSYRIAAPAPTTGNLTVYVVVSYVEPEILEQSKTEDRIKERFRFDQKTHPPAANEIELCRIHLQPGNVQLEPPVDPLAPHVNQIDLRYRVQAQHRPQAWLQIGLVGNQPNRVHKNLTALLQSTHALYPTLQGTLDPDPIAYDHPEQLANSDLFYLTGQQLLSPEPKMLNALNQHLNTGGSILVEVENDADCLKLMDALNLKSLQPQHWLKTEPFLFARLPETGQQPIQLYNAGGIVLVSGGLSSIWGAEVDLPRETIRSAQELGINILHFAWKRRHFNRLLQ
jgi:hypothetical protein